MTINKLHIGVLIGLLCGIALCTVSDSKPAYTAPTKLSGVQIPMQSPSSILLMSQPSEPQAEISTSTVTPLSQENTTPTIVEQPVDGSEHSDLLAAAGIDPSQWASAERLVHRESSWNPLAYNAEGACSLVQSLPCSKIPGDWTDPVTALTWGQSYVLSRYGSWDAALAHSLAFNYY